MQHWYFAASYIMFSHPRYDEFLARIKDHLDTIDPNMQHEIVEAKGSYESVQEWLYKWPDVCRAIDGGLFFVLDNAGYVGRGVWTEISDVFNKRQLPVYLLHRDGDCYLIPNLTGDFISFGPDWKQYVCIDVEKLKNVGRKS